MKCPTEHSQTGRQSLVSWFDKVDDDCIWGWEGPTNLRMMQFSEQINVLVFGGGGVKGEGQKRFFLRATIKETEF